MSHVTLRQITTENWRDAITLEVAESQQGLVASNLFSLAQAAYEPDYYPCGVYFEGRMVGFLMYRSLDFDGYTLWYVARLMIDRFHQGKGYGRGAMDAVMRRVKNRHKGDGLLISYVPGNLAAEKLYTSLGFVDEGAVWDDEICLVVRW